YKDCLLIAQTWPVRPTPHCCHARALAASQSAGLEEIAGVHEAAYPGRLRALLVDVLIADHRGLRQIDPIDRRQLRDHPGRRLAASASILRPVRANLPGRQDSAQMAVEFGDPGLDLFARKAAALDSPLVGDDENQMVAD